MAAWEVGLRELRDQNELALLRLARAAAKGENVDPQELADRLRSLGRDENYFQTLVARVEHRQRLAVDAARGEAAERELDAARAKLGAAEAALRRARERLLPRIERLRGEVEAGAATASRGELARAELARDTLDPSLRQQLDALQRERERLVERAGELRRTIDRASPRELRELGVPRSAPGRRWSPSPDEVGAERERRLAAAGEAERELRAIEVRMARLEQRERELRALACEP